MVVASARTPKGRVNLLVQVLLIFASLSEMLKLHPVAHDAAIWPDASTNDRRPRINWHEHDSGLRISAEDGYGLAGAHGVGIVHVVAILLRRLLLDVLLWGLILSIVDVETGRILRVFACGLAGSNRSSRCCSFSRGRLGGVSS
jgi:hypothetical protein